MIIQHNISAMNANRQMGINAQGTTKAMEKLSSGFAINRAGDNAAGLSISEKMRSQIKGLNKASTNSQDGISLIQTAEGALSETHSILQRMRELADQSANGTNTSIDRGAIQDEVKQLIGEVDRISNTTEFNTKKLINGELGATAGTTATGSIAGKATALSSLATAFEGKVSFTYNDKMYSTTATISIAAGTLMSAVASVLTDAVNSVLSTNSLTGTITISGGVGAAAGETGLLTIASSGINSLSFGWGEVGLRGKIGSDLESSGLQLQIGANQGQNMKFNVADMGAKALGIEGLDVSNTVNASSAITTLDGAIKSVSDQRSKLGAIQNRLEHTIANLGTASENLSASESRIRDTDMASTMMEYTKNNILSQAAQSMLAQANQKPQSILQLLG